MQSTRSLVELFARRWHVRALAHLHEMNGARFVVLKSALGISADSLTRCLGELMAAGWVQRNPGYGHPLRPEYILTDTGRALARQCHRFQATVARLDVDRVIYRKWSVPALVEIQHGVSRFSTLRDRLQVTPRALTQSLSRLTSADLVVHHRVYRPTEQGATIALLASALRPSVTGEGFGSR